MGSREALLLIGHGSAEHPDAGRAMEGHAAAIRTSGRFGAVESAVLADPDSIPAALKKIGTLPARVVPFFMEDGYFTRVVLPRSLPAGTVIHRPVGEHDAMAGIIERGALAACEGLAKQSRSAAVLVVGHGSASAPGRSLALHRHTARVAATGLFARVEYACLEEPPFIPDVLAGLRGHPVVVVGYFAGTGGHVRDDLPALIESEAVARAGSAHWIVSHGSVADDAEMVPIILAQAGATMGR